MAIRPFATRGVVMRTARTRSQIRVACRQCRWRGRRTWRAFDNPNLTAPDDGFGPCPACGGALVSCQALVAEKRRAKARAELAEQEGQACLR